MFSKIVVQFLVSKTNLSIFYEYPLYIEIKFDKKIIKNKKKLSMAFGVTFKISAMRRFQSFDIFYDKYALSFSSVL